MNSVKMRVLFFSLLIILLFSFVQASAADDSIVLNEKALKENLASRVSLGIASRDKNAAPFPADNVKILKQVPFQTGEFKLVAVKVRFEPDRPGQQAGVSYLVVNPDGDKLLEVQDVVTGKNLVFEALAEIRRDDDLPADLGAPIIEGRGKGIIIMVSDPFCSHCRQAYSFLAANKDKFKEVRLVHLPVSGVVSDAACSMIEYAESAGITPAEAAEFAYGQLRKPVAPRGVNPDSQNLAGEIIAQFRMRFPALDKSLPKDLNEAWEKVKSAVAVKLARDRNLAEDKVINFTPALFVDGVRMDGFNPVEFEQALELANRKK